MCLESGHYRITETPLVQSGWKQFNGSSSKPEFDAYQFGNHKTVPLNQWIRAEEKSVATESSTVYTSGFHIIEDEKDVNEDRGNYYKKEKLRRVYYRFAHTRGKQDNFSVVVAREMYVPANPNDWPPKD